MPARPVVYVLALGLLAACGGKAAPDVEATEAPRAAAPAAPPTLPLATMQRLVDSVDHVDYLFYELEFSMSMDQRQGINYAIATIGEEPAARRPDCKPIGRIFYEIGGNTAVDAQLYFSAGCTYLEFLDADGAVAYANRVSPVGRDFLNQQFGQIIKDYVAVE